MRLIAIGLLLSLGGCALFSTPGEVTDGKVTAQAGGVYGTAVQGPPGTCPSVTGMGSQTMGSLTASCTIDGSKVTQSITISAPDPNPALTTAYAGINQQLTTIGNILQQLMTQAIAAAAKPVKPVP